MKTRVSILLCALFATGIAFAVDSAGVRKALKPYVDRLEIPGYVSVLIDGDREEWVGDGWSDVERRIPLKKDSLFRICSRLTRAVQLNPGSLRLINPFASSFFITVYVVFLFQPIVSAAIRLISFAETGPLSQIISITLDSLSNSLSFIFLLRTIAIVYTITIV